MIIPLMVLYKFCDLCRLDTTTERRTILENVFLWNCKNECSLNRTLQSLSFQYWWKKQEGCPYKKKFNIKPYCKCSKVYKTQIEWLCEQNDNVNKVFFVYVLSVSIFWLWFSDNYVLFGYFFRCFLLIIIIIHKNRWGITRCAKLLILYLNGMAIFVRTLFCLIKGRPSTITENERTALTMLEEKEKEYDQLLKEVEMHENYLLANL